MRFPSLWMLLTLGWLVGLSGAARADERPAYNALIRPILAENCFPCHGPDSAARKADLRLDRRDAAVENGAILPGDPDGSELMARILSDDPKQVMPPPSTNKRLTGAQQELLKQWIASGAEYQKHWSFLPPLRPQPPAVREERWVRNPIDRFVLAALEARGLTPAPEADRRTLARRLSLDLTGLPPDPALVEAFVKDQAPDAYEQLVDRLLETRQWGEHRARYWLDASRYADTHGIHFDNYREIWSYRDWVIGAFNRNLPFDAFTIEQLAGDLLPDKTLEQQVASGFNRCNITTSEGGTIPEEYLVFYTRDRTETTSQVWMGLTAGCAVCHDHKFDPLSQREFYEMAAFFNNTTQPAMDGNVKDTPPILFVPQAEDRPRWDALGAELTGVTNQIAARRQSARSEFDTWLRDAGPAELAGLIPAEGLRLAAPLNEGSGQTLKFAVGGEPRTVELAAGIGWKPGHVASQAFQCQPGGVVGLPEPGDFERDQAFSYGAWVQLPPNPPNGSVFARMDDEHDYRGWDLWIEGGKVAAHVIHKWPTDAIKVASRGTIKPGEWNHLFVTYDGTSQVAGLKVFINGVAQQTDAQASTLQNSIRTGVPFKIGQRHTQSRIEGVAVQDLRIYGRALPPEEVGRLAKTTRAVWLAGKPADQRSEAETGELLDWWLAHRDPTSQKLTTQLASLNAEKSAIQTRGAVTHVMNEKGEEAMAYILFRGEYDKRRDPVKPSTPAVLPAMPAELPRNRLGFARWLLMPEHPLTTRVTVNRFWQEVFGTGLVRTSGDFGISGELPSHPELLDWLAMEFREGGWDVKRFFKLLVTSATYRQSAATTGQKLELDPQNRLLSRGPRFRMDGEVIRDYALAASGLLVPKIGGPSVKPYQPPGVWEAVAMIGSNTRDYKPDTGDNLYRRSLYTFWKRSAPPALLEIFNAPSRETCSVRRERTNTPLQALATLNDPTFVEAARHLAQRTLLEGGTTQDSRLDFLTRRI
ncbi:MAG: DUF1553 domain-containing protein, partial [Planctomycetales bacterium]